MELHPFFLEKNGKREFVVLPYDEFVPIEEMIEDAPDVRLFDEARRDSAGEPTLTAAEIKTRYGIE